jgi:hypothetical protein
VLALGWKHVDWDKFRIYVVCNFVRAKFGEPKSAASQKPVALHSLVMGLLKNWQETTAYAGDEISSSLPTGSRASGRVCRTMVVEDHLRPAAQQAIEIPRDRFSDVDFARVVSHQGSGHRNDATMRHTKRAGKNVGGANRKCSLIADKYRSRTLLRSHLAAITSTVDRG